MATLPDRVDDLLLDMWSVQADQQRELGLDGGSLSPVQLQAESTALVALLHEEAAELSRLMPTHKRHLLSLPRLVRTDAAEQVADVLKTVIAWAQLHGLMPAEVVEAFHRKTLVVAQRAAAAKMALAADTSVMCFDIDDVVCDIREWRSRLVSIRGGRPPSAEVHREEEAYKDQCYRDGTFAQCPPVPGAPAALRQIRDAGYRMVYVTARPQWQYRRLYADTLDWMERHQVPHDLVLFNKDKAEAVYEHISPAWPKAFVEDHDRNARALAAIGVNVLLFDQPHNQDYHGEGIRRVRGWNGVLEYLGLPTL